MKLKCNYLFYFFQFAGTTSSTWQLSTTMCVSSNTCSTSSRAMPIGCASFPLLCLRLQLLVSAVPRLLLRRLVCSSLRTVRCSVRPKRRQSRTTPPPLPTLRMRPAYRMLLQPRGFLVPAIGAATRLPDNSDGLREPSQNAGVQSPLPPSRRASTACSTNARVTCSTSTSTSPIKRYPIPTLRVYVRLCDVPSYTRMWDGCIDAFSLVERHAVTFRVSVRLTERCPRAT